MGEATVRPPVPGRYRPVLSTDRTLQDRLAGFPDAFFEFRATGGPVPSAMTIRRVAVIGSGTMGSGIAGHLANAGVDVVLLDVASDPPDRNAVANGALERMRVRSPPPFMHPDHAARISTGNVEDHLDRAGECDWIVEAIVERIDVKRELYDALECVRRPGVVVSSNTSTLPLSLLTERMSVGMRGDFCITHFFNPVRFMRLLELVGGPDTRPEVMEGLARFCDVELGKGVVRCRDTPGFLANRVGVHALQAGLCEAMAQGGDRRAGRRGNGPPRWDFRRPRCSASTTSSGLDLMLDVAASLATSLPTADAFQQVAAGIPVLHDLVAAGYTGNKGAGGFYRGDPGAREVVDLETGEFRPAKRSATEAAEVGERDGLRAMAEHPSSAGRFARRVLARVLGYAASLVPDVSDEIVPVDEAMKLGYAWSRGPFEMIDTLGVDWFRGLSRRRGGAGSAPARRRPRIFVLPRQRGAGRSFRHGPRLPSARSAPPESSVWRTSPHPPRRCCPTTRRVCGTSAMESPASSFTRRPTRSGPESMRLMREALDRVADGHTGLVIYSDAPHFSVGFDLRFVRRCIAERRWAALDEGLVAFQTTCRAAKHAPFPVVSAPSGMALGGWVRGSPGQRPRAGTREHRRRARRAARGPGSRRAVAARRCCCAGPLARGTNRSGWPASFARSKSSG